MATPINVVLQVEVKHLGGGGDVVRVRPGYARNYLIPRSLAAAATPANLARVQDLKLRAQEATAQARQEAEALKQRLESVSVKLARQVGEEGKMYGSVTNRDIEEAFRTAHGLNFDRKKLNLPDPIRTLGLTEVALTLHPEVKATLRVEVVKQG